MTRPQRAQQAALRPAQVHHYKTIVFDTCVSAGDSVRSLAASWRHRAKSAPRLLWDGPFSEVSAVGQRYPWMWPTCVGDVAIRLAIGGFPWQSEPRRPPHVVPRSMEQNGRGTDFGRLVVPRSASAPTFLGGANLPKTFLKTMDFFYLPRHHASANMHANSGCAFSYRAAHPLSGYVDFVFLRSYTG